MEEKTEKTEKNKEAKLSSSLRLYTNVYIKVVQV
jgi:hypothetical protein